MGLDITAFSAIIPAADPEDGYHVWDGGFAGRCAPFAKGHYEGAPGAEKYAFRAGSYSGYSHWRNMLSTIVRSLSADALHALPADKKAGPFVEHISFTDCDGSIGSSVATKLAKDYADWQSRIEEKCATMANQEEAQYFLSLYAEWRHAFEIAAGNGVVIFH